MTGPAPFDDSARPLRARSRSPRAEIRIGNRATYWPISPLDVMVGTPIVARLVLGATPIGRIVQAAALGAYLGSAALDWRDRRGVQRIDFLGEFGADLDHLAPMPLAAREAEIRALAERLNDEFTDARPPRREAARAVDRRLTDYIAAITGQRVHTSVRVRDFTLARVAFPFAQGACDILSGDVAIFRDTGFFEPHVIAHEFAHRKGYWKELHAQALAYLCLAGSEDPALRQAARLERIYRQLRSIAGDDTGAFNRLAGRWRFRAEVQAALVEPRRPEGPVASRVDWAMRSLYDKRMRLTGQNGISDYDRGFTSFLYTFENSSTARQRPPEL